MRRRHPSTEHAEAVSRRLAMLSAEMSALRPAPGAGAPGPEPVAAGGPAGDPALGRAAVPDLDGHTRVRGAVAQVPAAVVPDVPATRQVEPVVLRTPGRHALRRSRRVVPPAWLGRVLVASPAQLAVLVVMLVVALSGTGWLLWGGRVIEETSASVGTDAPRFTAPEPTSPVPSAAGAATGAAGDGATTSPTAAGGAPADQLVTVDVAGKVRRPGIVQLPAGSRVVDALEAAGGARRGVDLTPLNLARVLVDGEQVLVGTPAPAGAAPSTSGTPAPGALVNINTADQTLLETLPGVGPVTAGSIISWRTSNGPFSAVEELVEVDGIGEATLAKLAPLVTV